MRIESIHQRAQIGDTAYDQVDAIAADGERWSVGIMRCLPVSMVLPYDLTDGYFVLADEQRLGANAAIVRGIPGGTVDIAGEHPQDTAQRELAEELGLHAERWELIACETNGSPGRNDEQAWLWLAEGLSTIGLGEADAHHVRMPLSDLDREIARYPTHLQSGGPQKDLKTLTLLQALKLKLLAA